MMMRRIRDYIRPRTPTIWPSNKATAVSVAPIVDIPFPAIRLDKTLNPVPSILDAPDFVQTCAFFATNPVVDRSLVSSLSQALIYAIIRNQVPLHVVEIGTFRGGTTEAMSRAVQANGIGTVHTIGPFDSHLFPPVFVHWPPALKSPVSFYPIDSMAFFMELERLKVRPDLVFVDGNHDYEFALFDIQCAARRLTPGGFIVIDNVAQAGPYFATMEFLERHPDWTDCGCKSNPRDKTKAFDRSRSNIPGTDFMVLRAPSSVAVGERPQSFGEIASDNPSVGGLRLSLDGQQKAGTLHVQCLLRGFSDTKLAEVLVEISRRIDSGTTDLDINFEAAVTLDQEYSRYSVEPWLVWIGDGPLRLSALPSPI
jgi:predicted O-methyltransferase YrrM